MAFIPEDEDENIRPEGITDVQLDLSKDRAKSVELEVDIQELRKGNLAALNFSGDNLVRFFDENGLQLVNRDKKLLGSETSLLRTTRG